MKYAITDDRKSRQLLEAAEKLSPLHWAIATVLLETGCHISVLGRLTRKNIKSDVVEWRRPKTDTLCYARKTPELERAIGILEAEHKKSRQWYFIKFKEIAIIIKEPDLSPQSLRKTYCYKKIKEGYPDLVVTKMMGCGIDLVRSAYTQIAPEDLKRLVMEGPK